MAIRGDVARASLRLKALRGGTPPTAVEGDPVAGPGTLPSPVIEASGDTTVGPGAVAGAVVAVGRGGGKSHWNATMIPTDRTMAMIKLREVSLSIYFLAFPRAGTERGRRDRVKSRTAPRMAATQAFQS